MKWLSKVAARAGVDGLLHVIISALIVLIMQIIAPWWAAVLVAIVAGVAKELIGICGSVRGRCKLRT